MAGVAASGSRGASRAARARSSAARLPAFSGNASTFGGGDAGGVPVIASRIHAPRSTGAVRFGYDVAIRTPPLPSRPQRFSSASVDAAERVAAHVRRCRSAARAARSRTCAPPSAARARCDPRAARSSRNSSSSRANASPRSGSYSGNSTGSGTMSRDAADVEPLQREVRHERCGARIREHALDLRREHARVVELAALGERRAARRRAGGSRGRTTAATRARSRRRRRSSPAPRPRAAPSTRYRNSGLASTIISALRMPASKSPFARPVLVELERRREIRVGHGPAKRLARRAASRSARAHGSSSAAVARPADEDALAARRVAQARTDRTDR